MEKIIFFAFTFYNDQIQNWTVGLAFTFYDDSIQFNNNMEGYNFFPFHIYL